MSSEQWSENLQGVCVFTDPKVCLAWGEERGGLRGANTPPLISQDFFEGIQLVIDALLSSRPGEVEFEPDHVSWGAASAATPAC